MNFVFVRCEVPDEIKKIFHPCITQHGTATIWNFAHSELFKTYASFIVVLKHFSYIKSHISVAEDSAITAFEWLIKR